MSWEVCISVCRCWFLLWFTDGASYYFHPVTFQAAEQKTWWYLKRYIKKTVIKMRCERMRTPRGKLFSPSPRATVFSCIVESLSKPDIIKTHFDDSTQTRFAQFNFHVFRESFFASCAVRKIRSKKKVMKTSQLIHQIKRSMMICWWQWKKWDQKCSYYSLQNETQRADFRLKILFK